MTSSTSFILNPSLAQDSFFIADLELSQLRLLNKSEVLNLILIPKLPNLTELCQLTATESAALNREIFQLSHMIKTHFHCDKLNIASLGNLVPQLHIHIIARRHDDPFWPQAVFGLLQKTYAPIVAKALIEKLQVLCQ